MSILKFTALALSASMLLAVPASATTLAGMHNGRGAKMAANKHMMMKHKMMMKHHTMKKM